MLAATTYPRRTRATELATRSVFSPSILFQHQLPITPNENWRLIAGKGSVPKIVTMLQQLPISQARRNSQIRAKW
jgi:hypothetical protein